MKTIPFLFEEVTISLLQHAPNTHQNRYVVGIVGGPAAGKSTLATTLCAAINEKAQQSVCVVVPMDGFHYPNTVLHERNLSSIKGKPETFDAIGFVTLLLTIRNYPEQSIGCPAYDRHLHEPVANAIEINPHHKIVIVEGNYLLLDAPPWNDIKSLMNHTYYLNTPLPIVLSRIFKRHRKGGSSPLRAIRRILTTDLPNYFLVAKTKARADEVITI